MGTLQRRTKPTSLTVVFWNANSLQSKRNELAQFLIELSVDVCLVCETHLRACNDPKINSYEFFRADRQSGAGGGVGIYVKKTIDHHEVTTPATTGVEATSVVINTTGGPLCLTSVYKKPNQRLDIADLDVLFSHHRGPTILAGDLNCKHQSWNSRAWNANGRTLRKYADRNGLAVLGPADPTHYPGNTRHQPDVLDICVAKNVTAHMEVSTIRDLSSNHDPVILHYNGNISNVPVFFSRRIRWEVFADHLDKHVTISATASTPGEVEAEVDRLTGVITAAVEVATETRVLRRSTHNLPQEIEDLLRERRRARRRWQRYRDPAARTEMHRAARRARQALQDLKDERWEKLIDSLNPEDNSLWRMTGALRRKSRRPLPPIQGPRGIVYREEEKAEAFADSLEEQCSPNTTNLNDDHVDDVERQLRAYLERAAIIEEEVDFATPAEIGEILRCVNTRKSPGPDGVTNRMLRQLPRRAVVALTNLCNAAMRLAYFPRQWKIADVVVLPKPEKNRTLPQNYRPISLLSCVGKVYEKILLRRLQSVVDATEGAIPDEQHGFRTGHSTCHQLLRVIEHCTHGFNWNLSTGALFLDVAKAFDKVWHDGLIFKLGVHLKIPHHLVLTTRSYLQDRALQVKIGDSRSTRRPVTAGVPQGSLLSPLLFTLYAHDMPRTPGTELCQYADDTAILARCYKAHHCTFKLQQAADALEDWFSRWRIAVNASKSAAVLFSRKTNTTSGEVTMFGQKVPWSSSCRYLGVILDRRLKWSAHVTHVRTQVARTKAMLYPLICHRSKLSIKNKLSIYKQVIRPTLAYAAPVWTYDLSASNMLKLQQIQNICLRQCVSAPFYVRNKNIHQDLNVPYLEEYFKAQAVRFLREAKTHPNPTVRAALEYDVEVEAARHRRPGSVLYEASDEDVT